LRRSLGSLDPDEHAPVPSRAAPAAEAPAAPMKRRRVTPSLLNAGDIATPGSLAMGRPCPGRYGLRLFKSFAWRFAASAWRASSRSRS
jgi:hypothetical protein